MPEGAKFLDAGILSSSWGYSCWDNGTFSFGSSISVNGNSISVSGAYSTVVLYYTLPDSSASESSETTNNIDFNISSKGVFKAGNTILFDASDFDEIKKALEIGISESKKKGESDGSLSYVDVSFSGSRYASSLIPEGKIFVGAAIRSQTVSYYSYDNGGVSIYGSISVSGDRMTLNHSASLPFAGAPNNRTVGNSGTVRIWYK